VWLDKIESKMIAVRARHVLKTCRSYFAEPFEYTPTTNSGEPCCLQLGNTSAINTEYF